MLSLSLPLSLSSFRRNMVGVNCTTVSADSLQEAMEGAVVMLGKDATQEALHDHEVSVTVSGVRTPNPLPNRMPGRMQVQ